MVFERKHVVHSMTVKQESAAPASAPSSKSGKGEATISVDVK